MPEEADPNSKQESAFLAPPGVDSKKAEKYLEKLIPLIDQDKITVSQSDLKKFNLDCMEDHYRINLTDYEVEVSHSKHPDSGEDLFVMIFNNLKNIHSSQADRAILAYIHLTPDQFHQFKASASNQLARKKKQEEERRFDEVMAGVDQVLEEVKGGDRVVK